MLLIWLLAQFIEYMVGKLIVELIIFVGAKFMQECGPSSSCVCIVFLSNQPITISELTIVKVMVG